jgi:phosphatidylglycerol---prolipoprotein diacylglyceryl transferase
MLQYPGFDPVAFEIGPLRVHWYGIMYLVGFAAGWYLGRLRAREPESTWKPNDVDDLIFYAMLGVIFGGRIGYVLFYGLSYWAQDPLYPLKIWEGGMSFHGGLIGVMVAMAVFAWRRGRQVADVFDFMAPLPAVGLFAGRIGNFINNELWGKSTDVPWGFNVNGEVRHATQLYEAALEGVLLFVVLWWYTSKPRPRLAIYGVSRILVEFWRVPDSHIQYLAGGWLTMGHVLSLPMVIAGAVMLMAAYRRGVRSGNYALAQ